MIYSNSRLQTWERCGSMFEKRYIQGLEKEVTSANLVFGKAVHKTWAAWLLKWHKGEDYDMPAAFEEEWHRRTLAQAIEYNSRMKEDDLLALGREFGKLFPEAWEKTGLLLAVDGEGEPLVERHLMVRSNGVAIQGYLDLVAIDQDGDICIPDVKTPATATEEEYSLQADQLTLYQILVEANQQQLELDSSPKKLGFFEGIKRKVGGKKGPEVLPPSWVPARSEAEKAAYLKKVAWIDQQIREGQFHKRSLGAFESPCALCDYRELCTTGCMDGLKVDNKRRQKEAKLAASVGLSTAA